MEQEKQSGLLRTSWAGKPCYRLENVDSTNEYAKKIAEQGAEHGTLILAKEQTRGKGRRGRAWMSPKGDNIYMSILLRPQIEPNNASMLTLVAAMAVAEGIREVSGLKTQIKWPNDIVVQGKKVCGILTEMSAEVGKVHYVVIGIGINVHNRDFPQEIRETATSLDLQAGTRQDQTELVEAIWKAFEGYYESYCKTQDMSALQEKYNRQLANCDQAVKVLNGEYSYEGIARGITPKGELLVETEGETRLVSSGEVSVRGIYGYV